MPTLPSYAKLLKQDFAENRESAILRTEMEDGPAKQARIRSRVLVTRPVNLLFNSKVDYLAFLDWFSTDLSEGALWFDFVDPVRQTTRSGRFVGDGLKAQPVAGLRCWVIPMQIETWG